MKLQNCLLVLCASLLPMSVKAVTEKNVLSQMVSLLDSGNGTFYRVNSFSAQPGLKVYYTKFGSGKGAKGSLVIVPGRTEAALKYIEVAQDFIQRGYSPVYAIDHRGQGFTPTVLAKGHDLPDTTIGHVERFDEYVKDFTQFINEVVLKDKKVNQQKLFLLTNSMGGAIAMRYFQKNPVNPFKKSALSGSMFKIITGQKFALIKTALICGVTDLVTIGELDCYGYTPGEKAFAWSGKEILPDGRKIHVRAYHGDDSSYTNNLTSSKDRFRMNDYLWNKWPQAIVGGPSIKWSEQALTAGKVLRERGELLKVTNDIFLLIASRDFRVDAKAQKYVCNTLSKCKKRTYDSYHEILMETDSIRSVAMRDIFNYFEN